MLSLLLIFTSALLHGNFRFSGDGVIRGRVVDEAGHSLPGAGVVLVELNTGKVSGEQGVFVFRDLRDGIYTLHISHIGYAPVSRSVELLNGHGEAYIMLRNSHIELQTVVVQESTTGTVQPQPSLNITIANGKFLSGASSTTLMQSLQRIPGIQSMDIGSGISKPVIRGLGFNRLVIAQNNIKQQGQQWGADHGLEIDMHDVERVEVLKGPASLVFGSDAIGGALNIRPSVMPQENSVLTEVTALAHSNNDLLGGSVLAAINHEGRFFRVRYSHQDYADYRVPADKFVYNTWIIPVPDRRLNNTSGNDNAVSVAGGIKKGWGISSVFVSNFNQTVGFFPASHGIPDPGSLSIGGKRRNPDYPLQKINHFKVISNTNFLMGKSRLEIDLGFQQNRRQELNPPHAHGAGPLPEGDVELELILNTISVNAKYHYKQSDRQSVILGASTNLQENSRGGYNFLLPDYRSAELGLFAIFKHSIAEKVYLNAGIRADGSMMEVTAFEEPVWLDAFTIAEYVERAPNLSRSFLNMAFSTGVSWIPAKQWNLKMNLGRSYRNPTATELTANGVHHGSFRHEMGDSSLNPEKALQIDLGISYHVQDFYLHMSPFVNYFSNYLFLNPSGEFSALPSAGQVYRFQQAKALHLGGEIYADWHITHSLHSSLGAEWVWAQNLDENYPIPYTPPAALLGEITYEWEVVNAATVRLTAGARSVAAQTRVARNEPATKGYHLFNAGFSTRFTLGSLNMEVLFMVNNVFDVLYKNHLSFYRILELPEPGRNYTLRIKSAFGKY